jgi:adenylate kinase
MSKIVFVGGIHGVGKSYICNKISHLLKIEYLSCSNLINWTKISTSNNKTVKNISNTQELLLTGLKKKTNKKSKYILDGHFCLLNKNNQPQNIPFKTFEKINPKGLIVIVENVDIIYKRLLNRDDTNYSKELLDNFQNKEVSRAEEISKKLNIELFIYNKNFEDLIDYFNDKL